ncbi:MAG: DUF402 domain-containing protein [Erysipelotrichaceae bacterium]|nr:DUF402 domain-containing protein [Erysipelotrichaceae bacterium]
MNGFENVRIGDSIFVQSYKHNGSLHRTWSKALVIDVLENCLVVVTDHTWVVESDGRRWLTKEPAICFYYDDRWYNVISMIRKTGIFYYCNIASPSLYDGEAIKNIDYDLDVKVFPDGTYSILDENEYRYHAGKMNYPENIRNIVEGECRALVKKIEAKEIPFDQSFINDYLMKYFGMIFEEKEKEE